MEASAPSERRYERAASDGGLFERDGALAVLTSSLDALETGHGGVVVVEGAYGSGKTALLDSAAALARERGLQVLTARGRELERELELGVALQLFEARIGDAAGPERELLLEGPARAALPLFEAGPSARDTEAAGALVHGLYRLSANVAAVRPLVLAVDDADMADAATLGFLLYLAGRVEPLPIVLMLAFGSAVANAAADTLEAVVSHPGARRCTVQPLTAAGTAAWLRASFFPDAHDRFCHAVHDASAGSPWLIGELCRELSAAGVEPSADATAQVGAAAPEAVAASVMRRARAIEPDAAVLLEAAAVLGPGAEVRHAAGLTGLPRQRVAALMDALAGIGVLAGDERLRFVHPLVEASVHAALPAGERAEGHLWVAQALTDDDAPAEMVAGHLLRSGRGGGEWVTRTLQIAAARALATGAAERAVDLLERALQEPPPSSQRAHVLLELGRAQAIAGAPEALGRLAEAIERLPAAEERAATALETGRTLLSLGRLEEATAAFDLGVRSAADGEGELGPVLRAASATAARIQYGRVGRPGDGRHSTAADAGTPTGRALLAQLALDAALRGDPHEQVRELATKALARGALLDDEGAEGIVYYLATAALTVAEDLQMAEAALAAAVDDARSRGSALGLATASHFQSFAIMRRGRVTAAASAARAALAGERHGWRLALPSAHVVLAAALAEAGDLDGADAQVELAGLHGNTDAASRLAHLAGRADLHMARRRPQEALADFLACGELLAAAGAPNPSVLAWRSGAARALAAQGDLAEARRLADEELTLARAFGAPGAVGRSLRTIGELEIGSRAVEPLEAAVACLEDSQTALERARALVDLGCTLRRVHRPRDAREPLRLGLDLAERCGATQLAARAMREVTAAGARPRRTALHGLEALTPRELQTVGLAAEGKSNREIADALFVTVKTVEWHLKHSYGKLGISSRRELSTALGRHARPDDPAA